MDYEWDEDKNRRNSNKHGIFFEEALGALGDPYALEEIQIFVSEIRLKKLCFHPDLGLLVLILIEKKDELIRIISARKATNYEKKEYAKRI